MVPDAYEEYLKGRYFFNKDRMATAASYFEKATAKDPGFALAHVLLYEADAMGSFYRDLPVSARAL